MRFLENLIVLLLEKNIIISYLYSLVKFLEKIIARFLDIHNVRFLYKLIIVGFIEKIIISRFLQNLILRFLEKLIIA